MGGIHRKRARRPVTDTEYNKMMQRMVNGWQRRALAGSDDSLAGRYAAEAGTQELAEQLRESTNVVIYLAQLGGRSYGDIAHELGMTKAAVIKRAKLGEAIARQRETAPAITAARVAKPRELPARSTSG